jgi:prophage regulatory protein
MKHIILRLPEVKRQSGYPRSTLYLRIKQGLWPKPIKLGERSVGWPAHEISQLILARIAGKTTDEIRELVDRLEADRQVTTVGVGGES